MSDQATMVETVTLTIDGLEVTVPKGTTILQAAEAMGNRVPHYCYHPGLSAPAQCRLCLVEVEGAPKLQASCVTTVAPGQVVHTQSESAKTQRRGVLEFYLKNHPLDCPICDQSGECKLQDYVHEEGRTKGRSRDPKRVFGRDDFGGDVLFYGDRCVMCTRCVRFMNEQAQDPRLTVVERGNRSIIDTFFEEGLEGSPYAGNIVDICPVGALVSKDFLHKARAWDLDRVPSICPNCSQGCNIELHVRDNLVQRLKPRDNPDVNQHWMCDYGRHRYEWMNRSGRLLLPKPGDGRNAGTDGAGNTAVAQALPEAGSWESVLGDLADRLASARAEGAEVRAVASPFASNEDLGALRRFVDALGGGRIVFRSPRTDEEIPLSGFPKLVRRRDLAPNVRGAELLQMSRVGDDDATGGLDDLAAFEGILVVMGDELDDMAPDFGAAARVFAYLGAQVPRQLQAVSCLLPTVTHAETEGTFTNFEGRVQRFWPGLHTHGEARPAWQVLDLVVAAVLGDGTVPENAAGAFQRLAGDHAVFQGLRYEELGTRGALVNDPVPLPGA
jgi:NADH-quinone oxidoreductase subunit G